MQVCDNVCDMLVPITLDKSKAFGGEGVTNKSTSLFHVSVLC